MLREKIIYYNIFIFSVMISLVALSQATVQEETYENHGFLNSLEDLLKSQADLLVGFENLLHQTETTPEEKVEFLTSFEDLLRRQATLFKGFEDLLKAEWNCMDVDEQEKFLASFEFLLKKEVLLFQSFKSLNIESWDVLDNDEQIKLLRSFEDLLRRQTILFKSFEELLKMKRGGIIIEKSVDKEVVDKGEKVTYTFVVKNCYKSKTINNIVIVDDKLGTIASGMSLAPKEVKTFSKRIAISESVCNQAKVIGEIEEIDRRKDISEIPEEQKQYKVEDPVAKIVCDDSCITCVLVRKGGLHEPLQYEQYCEDSQVTGSGIIDVSTSIVDRNLALRYLNGLAGDGDIEIDHEQAFSEKASLLQRPVGNETVPLNFFEDMDMTYAGNTPLTGGKELSSISLQGGIGADIREILSVNELEKKQTAFFASTDPTSHVTDFEEASRLQNASPVHLVGIDTQNTYNGTWGTDAFWHKLLKKDLQAHQMFTGKFETKKLIKFHENPEQDKDSIGCDGIDC